MPAGFFTETATVLFERAPAFDAVAACVLDGVVREVREASDVPWFGARDAVRVFDAERNGRLVVDVVEAEWPDDMGDPKRDPRLFGAWSMGGFGRFTQPDALARARQQAWGQRELAERTVHHAAFVRMRTTYVIGGGDDAPLEPRGRSVARELDAIWDTALAVLALPGALAYFDPTAELLTGRERIAGSLAQARAAGEPPIGLYVHPRLFRTEPDRSVMDTLGMARLDQPDVELILEAGLDPNEAASFVLDLAAYHLGRGAPIPDGDTLDGPGGRYRVEHGRESVAPPRRPLVRLARV